MLKPGIFNDSGFLSLPSMSRLILLTVETMMNKNERCLIRKSALCEKTGISQLRMQPYIGKLTGWLKYQAGSGRGNVCIFEKDDKLAPYYLRKNGGQVDSCLPNEGVIKPSKRDDKTVNPYIEKHTGIKQVAVNQSVSQDCHWSLQRRQVSAKEMEAVNERH